MNPVLDFLAEMSDDYPGIREWYINRVIPGLRDGTRKNFYRTDKIGRLIALGIAKNDGVEKKMCTLRVTEEARNKGIGFHLADEMLKWMDTDTPHLTIGEHKLPVFERMFERYGFVKTSEKSGLYIPKRRELLFNESDWKTSD